MPPSAKRLHDGPLPKQHSDNAPKQHSKGVSIKRLHKATQCRIQKQGGFVPTPINPKRRSTNLLKVIREIG